MKEKLIDIVNSIDSCAKARRGTSVSPVARVHCLFDGKEDTYWFCNSYYSLSELGDIVKFGHFVPKNSSIAIKMQTYDVGSSFDYDHKNRIKRMVTHYVEIENRTIFQNQTISIAGDNLTYQFRNISEFLDALKQNKEDIEDVENNIAELRQQIEELKGKKDTARQRGQITKSINELQKEYRILTLQQEDLKNITIYIRKQGEMRYSLIVDPIQTRIKSQNLFDGKTVIINGGPGTGKSTTMIHRLAYLTDTFAINEDEEKNIFCYKLNTTQRKHLREAIAAQRDWMFFSPSQMLKEYLAEAMRKEGLKNTSMKVWDWKEYCKLILQAHYGLLGSNNSKAPFIVCNLEGTLFFQNSDIVSKLSDFYLGQLREIKSQLPQIDEKTENYAWTAIARNIQKRFEDSETFDLGQFVSLFNSLESLYGEDCKNLLSDKNNAISDLANAICELLTNNKDAQSEVMDLFDLSDELEEQSEEETAEEEVWQPHDLKLLDEIRKWLKAYCGSQVNSENQLSDEYQLIGEVLLPIMGEVYNNQIKKIGELLIFEQYAQYTKGIKAIMLNGFPARYKKFRSHLIRSKYEGCDLKLLRDVMQRKHGKELHHQEQSLILGFVNNLVKQIKTSTSSKIKHVYIEAYEEVARPIIGIDEATDFSACDIYAMQSLLTREFSSLTLCGDMMQRLTTYGITSWEELVNIVPDPLVVEMKTSYRQSKKLLDVARQMYVDTIGEEPSYKAFMKSTKVPAPLIYINENETSKVQWISKRISEVFRAYGDQLPSIAIFVNDKGYIPRFIEILQKSEFFEKNGVKVLDGTNRNAQTKENHICVYPIDAVKGMEFDVVFFHNIDNASVDTELLKRFIYVGVSRAAFFLGITMNEQNPEISRYFVQNKDWFRI